MPTKNIVDTSGEEAREESEKKIILFHTPTVAKVLLVVGLSFFELLCLQRMQNLRLGGGGRGKGTAKVRLD